MKRHDLILAALAAAGDAADFTPVQVQKLFFLIDREAARLTGGPHFAFKPYDYGPFDREVYSELDALADMGMVRIASAGKYRTYCLTPEGYAAGTRFLAPLEQNTKHYIQQIAVWVRKLSFTQLVAAIYDKYPDMKVNSIFNG